MPFIQIKNTHYYYETHGQGEIPILLISGYTCDHEFYYPIFDFLEKKYRLIVLDNRGVGQTIDDGSPLSAEVMATDMIALSEALELKNPHIIGQSMGGTIAQAIAAHYPDKIGKLVLVTTSAKWRITMLKALRFLLKLREQNVDVDSQFEAALPWLFGQDFLSNPEKITLFKNILLGTKYPESLEDQMRQYQVLEKFDGTQSIKNIRAETLIVYGKEDLISLPQESMYLHENIKNSKIASLNCAHVITVEVPEALGKLLQEFLW